MRTNSLARLLVAWAALALAACGGGGGSGVASTPMPPSTPSTQTCPDGSVIPVTSTCPPATKICPDGSVIPITSTCPEPPPPAHSPAIFPNVMTDTNFAALGWASDFSSYSLARDDFAVRYDAASQNYIVTLPGRSPAPFISGDENSGAWYAKDAYPGYFSISKPNSPDLQLTYTTAASYAFPCSDVGYACDDFGIFAFGSATPSSGVPTTGTASYLAIVGGRTLDNSGYGIGGSATLQFDFGAGTLGGHFDPMIGDTSLGRYDFISAVFGVGSTSFSGDLSQSGTTAGSFNGIFTGPAAQELMARWTASYLNPSTQQSGQMFGVWVGKRN